MGEGPGGPGGGDGLADGGFMGSNAGTGLNAGSGIGGGSGQGVGGGRDGGGVSGDLSNLINVANLINAANLSLGQQGAVPAFDATSMGVAAPPSGLSPVEGALPGVPGMAAANEPESMGASVDADLGLIGNQPDGGYMGPDPDSVYFGGGPDIPPVNDYYSGEPLGEIEEGEMPPILDEDEDLLDEDELIPGEEEEDYTGFNGLLRTGGKGAKKRAKLRKPKLSGS
jgi:hypothetical protein